jgi:S1-C subfamily serine protease
MKQKGLVLLALIIIVIVSAFGGSRLWPNSNSVLPEKQIYREILNEESVITKVVDEVTPSVVTVGIKKTEGIFAIQIEQNIGSGFIISQTEGLVITNKHVVADLQAEYKIITADNTELAVEKIYRDPVSD